MDWVRRKKLADQDQLACEQRGKGLKHQNYLTNEGKRSKTYIDESRKTYSTKTEGEKNQTKICRRGAGRRKLTDQEQLASEQRHKEVKNQIRESAPNKTLN
ncbi:hypothetical protein L798_10025 [Zootermopsis nevadensis]|uniref:Uncharacterized protein n=1 Tax=Zootermopsis nevadensis TaxID=136037 RepID=A0A067RBT9_ZOONE|nr:hypothetical protein L798_10025 [Zootermopsis nevadensis]